jgi:phosphohistidine phosphatase
MSGLRLYLLRHAKAVAAAAGMDDFDRPLATAGREEMEAIGVVVAREGYRPDTILCSSARRTRETLGILLSFLPGESVVKLTREVYEADADRLHALLARSDRAVGSLMIIGHNPAVEMAAAMLARDTVGSTVSKFPTGALAVMDLNAASWRDLRPSGARLVAFHAP